MIEKGLEGLKTQDHHLQAAAEVLGNEAFFIADPDDQVGSVAWALAKAEWYGASEMLERIRTALEFWPQDACDSIVGQMVKRIEDAAWARGCASGTLHPWVESMG
jgi:hypothetical protein